MRRPRPGIVTELLPVGLVLACVVGTFWLVLAMHQRTAARGPAATKVAAAPDPTPPPETPQPRPEPPPPQVVVTPPPPPPPEDPTPKAVAKLAQQTTEQRRAATEADRQAEALERARRAAVAESEKWRRRESIIRAQVESVSDAAQKLEMEADALAMDRDVLARERDAAKAALEKAQASGGGYAVLPNRGANGTWQRPVVIECRNGMATLQPRGLSFTMLDMSPLMGPRSSPLVGAVARELAKIQQATSPDGVTVVPYIYFIVRPDGIRPFYEARARLEPLGIAFGYELVDMDWAIDFPDVDTWEAGAPKRDPAKPAPGAVGEYAWPADRPGGRGDRPGDARNPFLWPRGTPGDGPGSTPGPEGSDGDSGGGPGGRGPGMLAGDAAGSGRGVLGSSGASDSPVAGNPFVKPGSNALSGLDGGATGSPALGNPFGKPGAAVGSNGLNGGITGGSGGQGSGLTARGGAGSGRSDLLPGGLGGGAPRGEPFGQPGAAGRGPSGNPGSLSDGLELSPLLAPYLQDAPGRRSAGGGTGGAGQNPGGTTTDLQAVNPDGLPGFERADGNGGKPGTSGQPGGAGGARAGVGRATGSRQPVVRPARYSQPVKWRGLGSFRG
jgi:hypothetical protein